MATIPYWHVDAFSAEPFGGNQAAVMILDTWLADETLLAIANENMFAATAFAVRDAGGAADWELRWFTPVGEIAMCGHATLAAGHALLSRDGGEQVAFRTRQAGIVEVRGTGEGYAIDLPAITTEARDYPEAVALLGAEPLTVLRNDTRHNIFVFEDEAVVRALNPDF
ncbi:MAG: PhzF family phenazine biosynthesis protein, partial [Pseudomonadota bacterium]